MNLTDRYLVQGTQAVMRDNNRVRITWTKADWADVGYNVYFNGTLIGGTTPTVGVGVTLLEFTNASLNSGSYFYVVGVRDVGGTPTEGTQGASFTAVQPAPETFEVTATDTSNGYLSGVTLSWTPVNSGSGYIIERSFDWGNTWINVTNITNNATTTYTHNTMLIGNSTGTVVYQITTRDSVGAAFNSTTKQVYVSPPNIDYTYFGNNVYGTINSAGQKNIYYIYNYNGYTSNYFYFYDRNNNSSNYTADVKFTVYRAISNGSLTPIAPTSTYDFANGEYYNNSNGDSFFIIVETQGSSAANTGTYRLRVSNY